MTRFFYRTRARIAGRWCRLRGGHDLTPWTPFGYPAAMETRHCRRRWCDEFQARPTKNFREINGVWSRSMQAFTDAFTELARPFRDIAKLIEGPK